MSHQYLLHLADGTEYGPIDRSTLEEWHREGRIPADALVWPDGAPEWLPVDEVIASGNAPDPAPPEPSRAPRGREARPSAAAEPPAALEDEEGPETRPPGPAPTPQPPMSAISRGSGWSSRTRTLLLLTGGVLLVVILLATLVAVLRPALARRSAIAAIERHSLADRRLADPSLGFVVDLPPGWMALADDNPYVVTRGARLRLAEPALGAFATAQVEVHPELMGDLDRHLDAVLQAMRPAQPSLREEGRSDVQLGRGQGRMARTRWEDGTESFQGATVAWRDGYEYYWLNAWAPVEAGEDFSAAVEELVRSVTPSGAVAARVDEAEERLEMEVPELSPQALRLLIGERMSRGEGLDRVPIDALREVSRGLEALSPAEAREMGEIYGKIWAPVKEAERRRLAAVLDRVKDGRPVAPSDVQALREVVKTGVVELPPEDRERLQELSGRALEKSILLR
jgi:hypothetical protein